MKIGNRSSNQNLRRFPKKDIPKNKLGSERRVYKGIIAANYGKLILRKSNGNSNHSTVLARTRKGSTGAELQLDSTGAPVKQFFNVKKTSNISGTSVINARGISKSTGLYSGRINKGYKTLSPRRSRRRK